MQIFRNRPLALAACVMALSSLLAWLCPGRLRLCLALLALLAALVPVGFLAVRRRLGRRAAVCLLSLLGVFVGMFGSWLGFSVRPGAFASRVGEEITVQGYVTERLNSAPHETRLRVELNEIDGERRSGQVLLECGYLSSLQPGERFRATGLVRAPENTALYPERTVLLSDGYIGILRCEESGDCTVYAGTVRTPALTLRRWNRLLCDRLTQSLGREAGALAGALLLGNRDLLTGDTELQFRRAGISHILALSGMHVSVLIGALELLLRLLRLPRRVRAFLVPPAALLYFGLTGCSPSIFRSVLMTCVLYLGLLFSEQYDSFTALCVALMLILTVTPYAVLDVSLWLSFVAAAGIVLFLPAVAVLFRRPVWRWLPHGLRRLLRGLVTALAVGLFSNAAILPLLALFFGSTSVFSLPATLALTPLLSLTLVLPALVLLLPGLPPLAFLAEHSLRAMLAVAEWFSDIPGGTVPLTGRAQALLLALLAASLLLCAVLRLRRQGWLLLPVALAGAVLLTGHIGTLARGEGTAAVYLRDGENEMLLLSRGADAVAVDVSDGSAATGDLLVAALDEAGCTELRELVFTHYHSGMSHLIASLSAKVRIFSLRLPEPLNQKEAALSARLEQEAALHGIPVCRGGGELPLPGAELLDCRRTDTDAVEVPVLLMLRLGTQVLTYLGSGALQSDWRDVAQNAVLSSDVLIFGCHGPQSGGDAPSVRLPQSPALLLFGSREQAALCQGLPSGAPVVAGVESHRFFLK